MSKLSLGGVFFPAKSPLEYIQSSKDGFLDNIRALLCGQTGMGKTFVAATMSEFWPDDPYASKPIKLEDTLWLSFDAGATQGFGQFNISVDELSVLKMMQQDLDFIEAGQMMLKAAKLAVEDRGIKTVVMDTVSMFDVHAQGYWFDTNRVPRTKKGDVDKYAAWNHVAVTHYSFLNELLKLPINVIATCHEKPVNDEVESIAKKVEAYAPSGSHDFVPAISGKSLGFYYQNLDIGAYLVGQKVAGEDRPLRKLRTDSFRGHMGKNRLQHFLDPEEEPNFRIMMKKMRAKLAAQEAQ